MITVVIPTTGNSTTVAGTLDCLNRCHIPVNFNRLLLVENGPAPKGADFIRSLRPEFKPSYLYEQVGNKSKALNTALDHIDSGLVVFFDDDVRLHQEVLIAYSKALEAVTEERFFFGGRCGVDYEAPPLPWVVPFLPPSARGWQLPPGATEIPEAQALGFNWAAFAKDLKAVGGFSSSFGPGSGARGQETEMQMRLAEAGVKGLYVPDAMVWHYVPERRCSPRWVLDRSVENGRKEHLLFSRKSARHRRKCLIRYMKASLMVRLLDLFHFDMHRGFGWRVKKIRYGYAAGVEK